MERLPQALDQRVDSRRQAGLALPRPEQLVDDGEARPDRPPGGGVDLGLLADRADHAVQVLGEPPDVFRRALSPDRDPLPQDLDLGPPFTHRRLLLPPPTPDRSGPAP